MLIMFPPIINFFTCIMLIVILANLYSDNFLTIEMFILCFIVLFLQFVYVIDRTEKLREEFQKKKNK